MAAYGVWSGCGALGPPLGVHTGTHVVGTIAAVGGNGRGVVGVAPGTRVVCVKVLDDSASGSWVSIIGERLGRP